MAKKKVAKSAKKKVTQSVSGGSNGSGTPGIVWFSRHLPFLKKNEGLTISKRQENAIKDCKILLSEHPDGKEWEYSDHKWEKPNSESEKFKLTVWIKSRNPNEPAPGDPPIPAQRQPPPGM